MAFIFNDLIGMEIRNWVPLLGAIPLTDNAYLKRRCGRRRSGYRWYVRVPVPLDLQELFRKRTIEHSLNTSDLDEARKRKHSILADIFASLGFCLLVPDRQVRDIFQQFVKSHFRGRTTLAVSRAHAREVGQEACNVIPLD